MSLTLKMWPGPEPADDQRMSAEQEETRVRAVPCDHMPMITNASAVVDVLMQALREAVGLR